ncbi:MAG: DUF167 domain-containing protein [Verrucomicrobia bacterium]|nr:DUF167 domain-containing protein [Verrucomicrobiota bacterium]
MPWLRATKDGVILHVKAVPRAHRTEVAGVAGSELRIRVAAPPVDQAANRSLRDGLAEWLGIPKAAVTLIRGNTSAHKQFLVVGISMQTAAEKLRTRR